MKRRRQRFFESHQDAIAVRNRRRKTERTLALLLGFTHNSRWGQKCWWRVEGHHPDFTHNELVQFQYARQAVAYATDLANSER